MVHRKVHAFERFQNLLFTMKPKKENWVKRNKNGIKCLHIHINCNEAWTTETFSHKLSLSPFPFFAVNFYFLSISFMVYSTIRCLCMWFGSPNVDLAVRKTKWKREYVYVFLLLLLLFDSTFCFGSLSFSQTKSSSKKNSNQ